ncbi:NAD-dependent epimerase/dehydratase family protein [Clostridium saccharoperbutylacetonicum]|uniref:NAD-dependent epimerase/dehydratase family protein n=1 Tax=Clostridium saccharoperbutylacetonicum TaxID=36745 RepID=UPI0039E85FCA
MNRNIVITGGTGFLGGSLVNTFKEDDILYNLGRNRNEGYKNIYWNLRDSMENVEMPFDVDTIIHCASIVGDCNSNIREYIDVNVGATLELLEYSRKIGIKQFIYISTGGVYGFESNPFKEEDQCNPHGIYSISKYFSEKLCMEYQNKIKITIIRVFFPYGKGQKGRLISNLIHKILKGEKVILNNEGMPLINPINIKDLCNIINGVVEKRLEGIFNACGDEIVSIKDLCQRISDKFSINKVQYEFNNIECKNMLGDNKKIKDKLNYSMKVKLLDNI